MPLRVRSHTPFPLAKVRDGNRAASAGTEYAARSAVIALRQSNTALASASVRNVVTHHPLVVGSKVVQATPPLA
jgi:hypothetical protein